MDGLPDEEVARVLSFLEQASLLEAPRTCRGLWRAAAAHEELLWGPLAEHGQGEEPCNAPVPVLADGAPFAPAAVPVGCIGPKGACRLRAYVRRRQLPSLPDALRCAADHGHCAVASLLLRARADPNAAADESAHGVGFIQVGAFPLHLAAKRGFLPVLDILLAGRADVDAADQNGRTGLMVAAASGQVPATQWLLANGAALDVTSHYGYTALHYAALLPRPEIAALLLQGRAEPGPADREGQAPLHVALNTLAKRAEQAEVSYHPSGFGDEYCYDRAASNGYFRAGAQEAQHDLAVKRTVSLLLEHGADPRALDGRGRSAGDILEAKRRPDLLLWLRGLQEGGRPPAPPDTQPSAAPAGGQRPDERAGREDEGCLAGCLRGLWRSVAAAP